MNEKWTLVGQVSEGGRCRVIVLRTLPFRVGRRCDLPLCLGQQTVSSCHAEFFAEGTALYLRDLNSRNGTYVNGERLVSPIEVRNEDLIQFADMPFRLSQHSTVDDSRTIHEDMCDLALGLVQFEKLFTDRVIIPYFQPVVDMTSLETIGFEILSRSRLVGLETPAAMFSAAAQLNQEVELSVLMRCEGVRASVMFPEPPHVFVNTHPLEISGEAIVESMSALRQISPVQPITVEFHEAAVTNAVTMRDLRCRLEDLNMRLAFDDFGAGQARLVELAEVRPHYLKFDRTLIQNINQASSQRQQMLAHLIRIVNELGVTPLAEGIETAEEAEVCKDMGCVLAQGYYYGRPSPVPAVYTVPDLSTLAKPMNRQVC
jgi:EAL domain-containing protein (putative c-di-GMP-specific phosphodiesterase class I)